jgi:hypothetical protein
MAKMSDPVTAFVCRRNSSPQISIGICGGDYSVKFPFDRAFLDRFKSQLPRNSFRWEPLQKLWVVAPGAIKQAQELLQDHFQVSVTIPELSTAPTVPIEKTFTLEYLGACKDRGGYHSAYGSVNGQWVTEFPEEVLKEFFEGKQGEIQHTPNASQTLYQVLLVQESVTDHEIKSAYRRLARQWHPDVCREDNAAEMFRKINEAYELLMDSQKRAKYDAGLYFERQDGEKSRGRDYSIKVYGYRSPLRCGLVTAMGTVKLGRFVISKILKWEDVTDGAGRVMAASWDASRNEIVIMWV